MRHLAKSTCDRLWYLFRFFSRGEAGSGDCTRPGGGKPAYISSSQGRLRACCIHDELRRRRGFRRRNDRIRSGSRDNVYVLLQCTLQNRSHDWDILRVEIDDSDSRIVVINRVVCKKVQKISIGVRCVEIQTLKTVRCVFWPKTVAKVADRRKSVIEYDRCETWPRLGRVRDWVSYPVVWVMGGSGVSVGSRGSLTVFPAKHELPATITTSFDDGNVRASWMRGTYVCIIRGSVILIDQ